MPSDSDNSGERINISGNTGDIIGVRVSGSGNVIGKSVVIGSGTINVDESQFQQVSNTYVNALKKFSESIDEQFKSRQISEEKVKSINDNLTELGKEVEGIKPGEEGEINYVKKLQVEGKTATLVQKILDVLPEAAENISLFTPLAPFSKIIGKSIKSIIDSIKK